MKNSFQKQNSCYPHLSFTARLPSKLADHHTRNKVLQYGRFIYLTWTVYLKKQTEIIIFPPCSNTKYQMVNCTVNSDVPFYLSEPSVLRLKFWTITRMKSANRINSYLVTYPSMPFETLKISLNLTFCLFIPWRVALELESKLFGKLLSI